MNVWTRTLALVFFFALSIPGSAEELTRAELKQTLDRALRTEATVVKHLSVRDLPFAETLFRRSLTSDASEESVSHLDGLWQVLGFRLKKVVCESEPLLLLRKDSEDLPGQGLFLFRPKLGTTPHASFLQAPHAVSDFDTGDIVFELFISSNAQAAAWNTHPRHAMCGDVCSDLTHRSDSAFHVATLAFAKEFADSQVVQVHGFSQGKRTSDAGKSADIIVSSGSTAPSKRSQEIRRELADAFRPRPVYLFAAADTNYAVRELGALKNEQQKGLRPLGYQGFVHLEFSRPLRVALSNSESLRTSLLDCLALDVSGPDK